MYKKILVILVLLTVLLLSGCVSQEEVIKNLAKQTDLAKDFLKENPNAEIIIVKLSSDDVSSIINEIRDKCGNQMQVKAYWKVSINDPDTQSAITSWIDVETQEVLCTYRISTGIVVTTTPTVSCSPCFSYFAYVNHDSSKVNLRNGARTISIGGTTYNPGDSISYSHGCTSSPCSVAINWKDVDTGVTHTDSATLHGIITHITTVPTTTPGVSCSPCFSYFAYRDYDRTIGVLRIRNGARTIRGGSLTITGGTSTDCSTNCAPGVDMTVTLTTNTGNQLITIQYIDDDSGVTHTDTATIHTGN